MAFISITKNIEVENFTRLGRHVLSTADIRIFELRTGLAECEDFIVNEIQKFQPYWRLLEGFAVALELVDARQKIDKSVG